MFIGGENNMLSTALLGLSGMVNIPIIQHE